MLFLIPKLEMVRSSSGEKYMYIIKPIYEEYLKPQQEAKAKAKPHKKMRLSSSLKQVPATATLLPAQAKSQSGEGISFLPSDPNVLIEKFQLLVLSYKAGNT